MAKVNSKGSAGLHQEDGLKRSRAASASLVSRFVDVQRMICDGGRATQRTAIVMTTPGFAENIVRRSDYEALRFNTVT